MRFYGILSVVFAVLSSQPAHALIHHELSISLSPAQHAIQGTDEISLPQATSSATFWIHSGLNPVSKTAGANLTKIGQKQEDQLVAEQYRVDLQPGLTSFAITYAGSLYHPLPESAGGQDGKISGTPGLISEDGVSLYGGSYWYPIVDSSDLITFNINASAPQGWEVMSQGNRTQHSVGSITSSRWESAEPQLDIELNAAQFTEYDLQSGARTLMAFLRTPDPDLANRYLNATVNYLKMYETLLGDYPYGKFALVENFWPTGYGMPSFTLIGSDILRLPFILTSSYPHEILHDWWGNSVFVDDSTGNWCEGTTSYMADHLLQEQQGAGADYRRDALEKFTNYVNPQNDFPLTKFISRQDDVTAAVGYDKALMFFHMLRMKLGDTEFVEGMRAFYSRNKFQVAGYRDIQKALEGAASAAGSPIDLSRDFAQWVTQTGAPELRVHDVSAEKTESGYRLHAVIEQAQDGPLYSLDVPIAIHAQDRDFAIQKTVTLSADQGRAFAVSLDLPTTPYLLEVDPEFDVFRRLARDEVPSSFSQAYGARKSLVLIPSQASPALQAGYRALADSIRNSVEGEIDVKLDSEIANLPADQTVWILGWENAAASRATGMLADYGLSFSDSQVTLNGASLPKAAHSFAWTIQQPANPESALVWIAFDDPAAAPTLGMKLPHYGKFSYAAFNSAQVINQWKGEWPALHSSLSVPVKQSDGSIISAPKAKLAPRSALIQLPPGATALPQ